MKAERMESATTTIPSTTIAGMSIAQFCGPLDLAIPLGHRAIGFKNLNAHPAHCQ